MILVKFVFDHISIVISYSRHRIINNSNLLAIINITKIDELKIIWGNFRVETIALNLILIGKVGLIHVLDEFVHWDFARLFGFDYLNCGNIIVILETLRTHHSTAGRFVLVDRLSYEVAYLKHIKLRELKQVLWLHQSCKELMLIKPEQLLIIAFHIIKFLILSLNILNIINKN